MDIFLAQLVGFAVVLFILWKWALPPLKRMVANQQDTINQQVVDSDDAAAKVVDAKAAHERAVEKAKTESAELHAGALEDAESIQSDLRVQADSERKRIAEHGKAQTELVRANLVRQLRTELGTDAIGEADRLVRAHLSDPSAQSASIDKAIDELEAMAAGGPAADVVAHRADLIGLHSMRATSRDAARAVAKDFDDANTDSDSTALTTASHELTEVLHVLNANPVLRKKLTEDDDNAAGKEMVVRNLFGNKVSPIVVEVLVSAVKQRWSTTADFVTALRRQNALIVLTAAERDNTIEQTEDDLFAVARLLEQNPRLASLLADHTHPAAKRTELLKQIVGDNVGEHAWYLLSHSVALLHGQPADVAVDQLAELAAARRGESVAHVVSAAELSDAQAARLASVLGTIYGRTMSVQTEIDPELVGGLRVAVGDEIIEADVATRLAKASASLPR
ncbi:F0F1 ATP synthase subunit B/delta [Gordonia sp. CPCC 205515]|uniref:F0F1 ATP synthase subunit B/delta n=1 Tax=Gordonia sp. CPCC 205515 TaxID=3140791 RepID=UPI003AF35372